MEYDLKIKEDETLPSDSDEEFPPIVFEGICHGAHRSKGLVKGTVSMFAPGVIRWTFVSSARFLSLGPSMYLDVRSIR